MSEVPKHHVRRQASYALRRAVNTGGQHRQMSSEAALSSLWQDYNATLMMPPIRLRSSSTSEGETFSRVVATSSTPPSCHTMMKASQARSLSGQQVIPPRQALAWYMHMLSLAFCQHPSDKREGRLRGTLT